MVFLVSWPLTFDHEWTFYEGIDGSNKSAASKCLGLRDGKWKLFDTNPPLLYDLENDLSEQFDLYKTHTALANQMKQKETIDLNFWNFFSNLKFQSHKAW